MKAKPPPRLYGLLATQAPVALVFRRGPTDWWHLLRWRLDTGELEPGAWVNKILYPRRCDLSADGELLLHYLAGGFDGFYSVFCGISRAPWLYPLDSSQEHSTYSTGFCFADAPPIHVYGETIRAIVGDKEVIVQQNDSISFRNERRRGWVEAPDSPPRAEKDGLDSQRQPILHKRSPLRNGMLRLVGSKIEFNGVGVEGQAPSYELRLAGEHGVSLPDVQWADWDDRGRLLTMTHIGFLQASTVRGDELDVVKYHDLSQLKPDPQPPPAWATAAL